MILALIGAPGSHALPTVDDELARAQRNVSAALAARRLPSSRQPPPEELYIGVGWKKTKQVS